jgi:hypothetical protein
LWGLFFAVTRLLIGVTQGPCKLKDLQAGDIILRCGCGGAIAGLIVVVTDVLGVFLKESDSNEQSGDSND